jgi:hypothetical protein
VALGERQIEGRWVGVPERTPPGTPNNASPELSRAEASSMNSPPSDSAKRRWSRSNARTNNVARKRTNERNVEPFVQRAAPPTALLAAASTRPACPAAVADLGTRRRSSADVSVSHPCAFRLVRKSEFFLVPKTSGSSITSSTKYSRNISAHPRSLISSGITGSSTDPANHDTSASGAWSRR